MPEVTSEDAYSGCKGSTVVLARLNERTPATEINTPHIASNNATDNCMLTLIETENVNFEIPHIVMARIVMRIIGGILFSINGR